MGFPILMRWHWIRAQDLRGIFAPQDALDYFAHYNDVIMKRDGVSNHQPSDCLLNRLFRRSSKKTSKLRVTGLCAGNSPVTGEFPTQRASGMGNVSIWWRHHAVAVNADLYTVQMYLIVCDCLLIYCDAGVLYQHWNKSMNSGREPCDPVMLRVRHNIKTNLDERRQLLLILSVHKNKIASSKRKLGCASAMHLF